MQIELFVYHLFWLVEPVVRWTVTWVGVYIVNWAIEGLACLVQLEAVPDSLPVSTWLCRKPKSLPVMICDCLKVEDVNRNSLCLMVRRLERYLLEPIWPKPIREFLIELYGGGAGVAAGFAVFTVSVS